MNFINDEVVLRGILSECFPHAKNIEILKISVDEETKNFTTDICFVTIRYEHNKIPRIKNLAFKIPYTSLLYTFYEKLNHYNKEVRLYEEFLPHINAVLHKKILPKHYFSTDMKMIILENLAEDGFKSARRNKFFNLEESQRLLGTLALFHAASYKIHRHYPILLDDPSFQVFKIAEIRKALVDTYQPVLYELLKQNNAFHLMGKFEEIMTFLKEEDEGVNSRMDRQNFEFFVLNHGDYWNQNILLRRDQRQRVEDVRIIDFQSCMWSTPVLDFLNFLIVSVHVDVVDQYFDTLVQSYLNSLNEALVDLNCPYTYDKGKLMDDLEQVKVLIFDYLLVLCGLLCIPDIQDAKNCFLLTGKMIGTTEELLKNTVLVTTVSKWLKYYEKWGAFNVLEKRQKVFRN